MATKRLFRKKSCTGKAKHKDQSSAILAIISTNAVKRLVPYRCGFCGWFHIGRHSTRKKPKIQKQEINLQPYHPKKVVLPEEVKQRVNKFEEQQEKKNRVTYIKFQFNPFGKSDNNLTSLMIKMSLSDKVIDGETKCIKSISTRIKIHETILYHGLQKINYIFKYNKNKKDPINKVEIINSGVVTLAKINS